MLHFNPFSLQKRQSFIFLLRWNIDWSTLLCFQSGLPEYRSMDCFSLATRLLMCFQQSLNLWICFTAESIDVLLAASVISKEQFFQVTLWFCNLGLRISLKIKSSLLNECQLGYLKIRISSCRKINRPSECWLYSLGTIFAYKNVFWYLKHESLKCSKHKDLKG